MNTTECLEILLAQSLIPEDAEVVSTNNKLVVISASEQIVARIGEVVSERERDDPHDLTYSHRISWLVGEIAPVVRPIDEHIIRTGSYVISRFPLMNRHCDLSKADEANNMIALTGSSRAAVDSMPVRSLNIPNYVKERLMSMHDNPQHDQLLVTQAQNIADKMNADFPFIQLCSDSPALVHGDCKADNVVTDKHGRLMLIDLDAAAIGPRQYDLASWRLRSEMGDNAPVEQFVEVARRDSNWNEDTYRALIGWKALSSISFTLRYGERAGVVNGFNAVLRAVNALSGFANVS